MSIIPDAKDWTWVLTRRCDQCGFDATRFPRENTSAIIRDSAAQWRVLLSDPLVVERPAHNRWSGLEYACHVRDVLVLYRKRLKMMLEDNDPLYPNWDQDEAAKTGEYALQEPEAVANDIELQSALLAARFDMLRADQWERPGRRSDGARFTVESFAQYFIHEAIHHLHDVHLGYERLSRQHVSHSHRDPDVHPE